MFRRNLMATVYDQIPEGVRDKFKFDVEHDPFYMQSKATFVAESGVKWECDLEPMEIEGVPVSCKVPEHIISLLCTVA